MARRRSTASLRVRHRSPVSTATPLCIFLTRAVAELALLAVSEQRESSESLSQFWSEVQELRDLFKFEFFYPDTQLFEQQIDVELCRDEPNWRALLSENPDNARLIMNRLSPKLGHVALTVFAEAYSIGTDILIRHSGGEPMEEEPLSSGA